MSILSHPGGDTTLPKAERKYADRMVNTIIGMHKQAELMAEDRFVSLGAPNEICHRASLHAALHRVAMLAAFMLAHFDMDDDAIEKEIEPLIERLTDLVKKQVPVTANNIKAKRAADGLPQ